MDKQGKCTMKTLTKAFITFLSLLICLVTFIISYKSYHAYEAEAAPYFVAMKEPVTTADNISYAMSLKNIGGNIRSVKCNYVDYLKTTYHDESTGIIDENYVKIIIEDNSVKYDYKTNSIPIIENVIQLMAEIEYIEPILKYDLYESLYCKYLNEYTEEFYAPCYLDYELIRCLQIDYKDYKHKNKKLIVEIPRDSELENYEIKERNDLPRISDDAVFYVGRSTKIDVGSMIFKQHGIKYRIVNEHFIFLH